MPKMKTNKAAARRFKITGKGKVMRARGMKSHFRRRKAKRTKRMFDKMYEVAPQGPQAHQAPTPATESSSIPSSPREDKQRWYASNVERRAIVAIARS